jgi:hypothetical protein
MALVPIASSRKTVALGAGVPTPVDFNPVGPARTVVVNIKNTGANPITAATAAKSPTGVNFSAADNLGSAVPIAAGAVSPSIEFTDVAFAALRLTLTSPLGSACEIELQSY